MKDYKSSTKQIAEFPTGGPIMSKVYPSWIIPDVRFPNELKSIEDRGGFVIRVNRTVRDSPISEHISETSLDDHKFKYTINFDKDIKLMIKQVKDILIKESVL